MRTPTLQTERLILRPHKESDFDAAAAMWGDERVVRYISGTPSSRSQTWMRMLTYAGHWQFLGFGYWAIAERATGCFVGEMGFADFRRDVSEDMRGVPELGFALSPEYFGLGYATEAGRAALAWADDERGWARTTALANPSNTASLRVLEKLGYAELRRGTLGGLDTVFLERRVR